MAGACLRHAPAKHTPIAGFFARIRNPPHNLRGEEYLARALPAEPSGSMFMTRDPIHESGERISVVGIYPAAGSISAGQISSTAVPIEPG